MDTVLLHGAAVWDGSGGQIFSADMLIEGDRIADVWPQAPQELRAAHRMDATGHTIIPGLVDGHAHLSFLHKTEIAETGEVPPEEHMLQTRLHARIVLEADFTSCASGGSAKPRVDVALRDEIDAGHTPGPRLLAASPELTNTGNLGDERRLHIYRESIALVVDGEDEMLRTCRSLLREGVDTLKLNISGNQTISGSRPQHTVMREEEVAAAARTAHAHGKRIAAHVRAAASIKSALRHGIDILYHCEYADEECLDLLEAARDRIFVAPAIGLLHNTIYEAAQWDITYEKARDNGLVDQFECEQEGFAE